MANSVGAGKLASPAAAVPAKAANADPKGQTMSLATTSRSVSVFDPLKHHPPRIDQFGYNKETHKGRELLNRNAKNVLFQPARVPQWWHSKTIRDTGFRGHMKHASAAVDSVDAPRGDEGEALGSSAKRRSHSMHGLAEKMTLTKLKEIRKKEILPDLSYDLDGDGFVGGRDYVVARRFDEGFKNYLTDEEKAKVKKALQDGYEDNFIWNVEGSGAQRPYRIMQKRGVIVDGDDFLGVTATYPQHPLSEIDAHTKTGTQLIERRKALEREDIR